MIFSPQAGVVDSLAVRFYTYTFQYFYRLSLARVHHRSNPIGVMLLAKRSLVHCHQGSVLLYVKCGPSTIDAITIGRTAVATIACWNVGTIAAVVTASINSDVGVAGFHCPVPNITC